MGLEHIRSGLLKVAGYLIPLVQSLPPLGIWGALMTVPFASYLILIFSNLPTHLPRALLDFFAPISVLEKICIIGGFGLLVYSTVHLLRNRREGLVTSGPYRSVRHPQYLGMILLTLGLTSWSVWILNNTFGTGFLRPSQTIAVWFLELVAYIVLALIEERHLAKTFGEAFADYKTQVPFLIPYLKTNRAGLDILCSIAVPAMLLSGLILLQTPAPVFL